MKNYKPLILTALLTLIFGSVYAQSEKPQLTWVKNPYKEMQGGYLYSYTDYIDPIVYKDKLYMGYVYGRSSRSTALVTFDGQNWTSSISKDKSGKVIGANYKYKGGAVIFQDKLFMIFKNNARGTDFIRYTDGKTTQSLFVGMDDIYHLFATPDKIYLVCSNKGDKRIFLWAYDGKDFDLVAFLPKDCKYLHMVYYKGKVRFKGEDKIYTLSGKKFLSYPFKGIHYTPPIIWQDELCYLARRTIKDPCTNTKGELVKEGLRMVAFDGEKITNSYYLAKNHTSASLYGALVADGNLYTTQESCKTGKQSFVVNRDGKRAFAYTYGIDCDGQFIKYKNSIFAKYDYYNNKKVDSFLTSWTFDSENKLDYKRVADEYVYVDGKAVRVFIYYLGYPIIFKGELYLAYGTNNDTSKKYLMKYTP